MNILDIVQRLSPFERDKLVEHIDRDFYLDNTDDVLGITNAEYLATYIEANPKNSLFKEIMLVHNARDAIENNAVFMKVVSHKTSGKTGLTIPVNLDDFFTSHKRYTDIIKNAFGNRKYSYFQIYRLTKLVFGFSNIRSFHINHIINRLNVVNIRIRRDAMPILVDNLFTRHDRDTVTEGVKSNLRICRYIFFHCVFFRDVVIFDALIDRMVYHKPELQIRNLHILEDCEQEITSIGHLDNKIDNLFDTLLHFDLLEFFEHLVTKIDLSDEFSFFSKKAMETGRPIENYFCIRAIQQGKLDFVKFFIRNGCILKDEKDFSQLSIVSYLNRYVKDSKANAELTNYIAQSQNIITCMQTDPDVSHTKESDIQGYIESGGDIEKFHNIPSGLYLNPLMLAVHLDNIILAKYLLEDLKVNPHAKNFRGYNAAFYVKSVDMLDVLFQYNVDFNQVSYIYGFTPIFSIGEMGVIEKLKDKVNLNHRIKTGDNILSRDLSKLDFFLRWDININILLDGQDLYDICRNDPMKRVTACKLYDLGVRGFKTIGSPSSICRMIHQITTDSLLWVLKLFVKRMMVRCCYLKIGSSALVRSNIHRSLYLS